MPTLYTIGHSNQTFDAFIETLHAHGIQQIIDVRTMPTSRRYPWFNQASLAKSLAKEKINYHHLPALGGLRKTNSLSENTAWENASFRGFADYMQTKPFFEGLKMLNQLLKEKKKTAMMCAEVLPWRCHRSLISDAEIARGVKVIDIFNQKTTKPHELTSFAVIDKSVRPIRVYYPGKNLSLNI